MRLFGVNLVKKVGSDTETWVLMTAFLYIHKEGKSRW